METKIYLENRKQMNINLAIGLLQIIVTIS